MTRARESRLAAGCIRSADPPGGVAAPATRVQRHGADRTNQRSALTIEEGTLYPALYRLEHRGFLATEWGTSENNRRAKYYRLTAASRKCFNEETAGWHRLVAAMSAAFETTSDGV